MKKYLLPSLALVLILGFHDELAAQKKKKETSTVAPTEEDLLKGIKAPAGFKVTMFGMPPDVNYPTCLACAPTGEVFVGIDPNGSLDAKPGRGYVLRCVDSDGDGKLDKSTVFAKMDSPRGLVFDHKTLYVLHPPLLTAFHDDDGDGVADREEILVKGIGFDLKFRGADHTTNGIRLGIDGFLYVAVGDYGFVKAEGKDGRTAQLRGGGIARVRTDGSGLEVVAIGTRNIYDVAIDPLMNLFTRDNTNDGDGWDVRLSHIVPGGNYGYPSFYKNFADELIAPLADYGGGSPTGSFYLAEPGYPAEFGQGFYTCEWGRSAINYHPLQPNGSTFKAEQKTFISLPRPTDMDVDGAGRMYISSWREGGFNYTNPFVGYVIRVTPPNFQPRAFPDLAKASDLELVRFLESESHVLRLHATREIVRRGDRKEFAAKLPELMRSDRSLPSRVAAIYAYSQNLGPKSIPLLSAISKESPALREHALRALIDQADFKGEHVKSDVLERAIKDENPRVRLITAHGFAELNLKSTAASLVPLVADSDAVVAHVAINTLVRLGASQACFEAIDSGKGDLKGCLRVLHSLHEPAVVEGILARYQKASASTKPAYFQALCRLHYREGEWKGSWWGTRPDTTGPYFKHTPWQETDRIASVLKEAVTSATPEEIPTLVAELQRHKIVIPEAQTRLLALAANDAAFRGSVVDLLSKTATLSVEASELLEKVAGSKDDAIALRLKALKALSRGDKGGKFDSAVRSYAALTSELDKTSELKKAWEDYTRDSKHGKDLKKWIKLTEGPDSGVREVAFAVLLQQGGKLASKETKAQIHQVVEKAWPRPELAIPLLHAIGRTQADQYAFQVKQLEKDERPEIRAAAILAVKRLDLDRDLSTGPRVLISSQKYEDVLASAIKEKGSVRIGGLLFNKQGCIACHTISKDDPPKGPFLGDVTARYKRNELVESILKPSAKIAQGFETQAFVLDNGKILEGFIVRESADEIEIRNIQGVSTVIAKSSIEERARRDISIMPNGLADNLTIQELASILAYLESLNPAPMP